MVPRLAWRAVPPQVGPRACPRTTPRPHPPSPNRAVTPDPSLLRVILHRATRGPVDLPELAPFERVAGELDAALK